MEETLVNLLQDDASPDGVLELEPMSPYNRLLVHRLADIFGFSHNSVGDGDDRHLILERCPESAIPPILVSDILWQYDECQSPTTHQLLRRKEALPDSTRRLPSFRSSLEEREAAYLAARQRIFSIDDSEAKQSVGKKPRNIPVVARRMIAHALGQRINLSNEVTLPNNIEYEGEKEKLNSRENNEVCHSSSLELSRERLACSQKLTLQPSNSCGKPTARSLASDDASQTEKMQESSHNKSSSFGMLQNGSYGRDVCRDSMKQEHLGAARRMLAHALGRNSVKENPGLVKCSQTKPIDHE
ncbi:PREDICTED: uncharacterized protein LOC104598296 isoform X2 [Nelumbo nucifera]|nr:PREDICTED: uncharacterized protein LOC104598296 isoform X2 [Nelumbo nucifera]